MAAEVRLAGLFFFKKSLFKPDNIHLSPEGYDAYAARLKPILEKLKGS